MQPLRLNHKLFQLVNLCESLSGRTNRLHFIFGLYVFLTLNLDLISSSFLFIQFKDREKKEVLGSVMQIAGLSCCIFQMITLFARSKRLTGLFVQFQTIYDECNYEFYLFVFCIAFPSGGEDGERSPSAAEVPGNVPITLLEVDNLKIF